MSARYTPGEWIAFQNVPQKKSGQWSVGLRHKYGYHGVGDGNRYMLVSGCCEKEDANLIAAAPEILDALRGAIGALEFSRDYHSDLSNEDRAFAQDKLDAALKAIAKATGGAA